MSIYTIKNLYNVVFLLANTLHFANEVGEDQASIGVPPQAVKINPIGIL